MVQKRPMKPVKRRKRRTTSGSIAERYEGREPSLDKVRFSARWRPFGLDVWQKQR